MAAGAPDPQRRFRAPLVLAGHDAGTARPIRPAAARRRGRRRHRRWLHGDQRGPGTRPSRRRGHAPGGRQPRFRRLDAERRDRPCRLQVGPARADPALRRRDRASALPRDARRLRDRQTADRRRGDRLRLPRSRVTSSSPTRRRTSRSSITHSRTWPPWVSTRPWSRARGSARRSVRTPTTARWSSRAAACSTRAATSPAWQPPRIVPAPTCTRAFAPGRSGARPTGGSWSRPSAERSSPATCSSPRTATRTAWRPTLRRRIIPIGSYIIASEPLPEELARELSPKGRSFFDTKNFLYYWHVSADRRMVFGGRASFMPTSIDHTAAILHRGPARGPPAARRLPDRLRLGRQRRLHLRPDAARRSDH